MITEKEYAATFSLPAAMEYLEWLIEATARHTGVSSRALRSRRPACKVVAAARRLAMNLFAERYPYFTRRMLGDAFGRTGQWAGQQLARPMDSRYDELIKEIKATVNKREHRRDIRNDRDLFPHLPPFL